MADRAEQRASWPELSLREGRVTSVEGPQRVAVELPEGRVEARVALGLQPRVGDRALLGRGEGGGFYVIGLLAALREAEAPGQVLRTREGASAERLGEGEEEALVVRDAAGALVFEYRPAEEKSIVHARGPNLELRAEGSIDLSAGREVRLCGQAVELSSQTLRARAQAAEVQLDEARLTARSLRTFVDKAHQVAGVLEVRVNRIVERAKDVYREAEGLSQQRAGRLKLFAESALHVFGKRAYVKAEQDLKLDADKIHLG